MATNSHGLDVNYITKNLDILKRDAENYTPNEMSLALTRLASACTNSFAVCRECGGYKTRAMQHYASLWFCDDCNKTYELK